MAGQRPDIQASIASSGTANSFKHASHVTKTRHAGYIHNWSRIPGVTYLVWDFWGYIPGLGFLGLHTCSGISGVTYIPGL